MKTNWRAAWVPRFPLIAHALRTDAGRERTWLDQGTPPMAIRDLPHTVPVDAVIRSRR